MIFTEFSESRENPKVVWLPGTYHKIYNNISLIRDILPEVAALEQ